MIKYMLSLGFFLALFFVKAQNKMQSGFQLLENGKFEEAEQFFETYLDTNPENKTAQLCYARAVGLSGAPEKATQLFTAMLETYPNDFEVLINYNESYLWAKKYTTAEPLYKDLVKEYPHNFGAVLGYANTLSNLKKYEEALLWVNKALLITPDSENAKISRKYMYLGYANTFINDQEYTKGQQFLERIFIDFPEDKDAILNLANLYLITKNVSKAKETYKRYAKTPKDTITALNGIALAEHIGEKDKEALKQCIIAKSKVEKINDFELQERTYDRYVQALIWNQKFVKARKIIDSLEIKNPNRNWILALRATHGLYTGNSKTSVESYGKILENDLESFDGNLGIANALFASDHIMPAYKAAFKTLAIYKNQKDATSFIAKLNTIHTPTIAEHMAYTFDNGNNIAFFTNTTANIPLSTKFRTTLSYLYRTTENTVSGNKANSHVLVAGLHYKLFPKAILKSVLGINNAQFINDAYTQPVLEVKLGLQPFKMQNLEIGYQREVQNFNADLIEREIVLNNYSLTYNLGTNFNLGWYTQLIQTQQSDANRRKLLFTSLYYTLLKKPALKMGVNYQYISFKNQLPTIYFSPEKYKALEIFADIRGTISEKTSYMASAATGIQKVETDPNTTIFRAEANLKHQFTKRFSGSIYGKYSNIASATAAGFEFTELGIKLKWLFSKNPLFYKKLRKLKETSQL